MSAPINIVRRIQTYQALSGVLAASLVISMGINYNLKIELQNMKKELNTQKDAYYNIQQDLINAGTDYWMSKFSMPPSKKY
jgi:hypothetical protein